MLYDLEAVKAVLPHRDPFLLIDGIESIDEENKTITGVKDITENEFWVKGHFPQEPVMPGVLICETIAQAGAFYILNEEEYKGKIAYFARMDKVRFKNKVVPGDTLKLEVKMDGPVRMGIGKASGKAFVDGKLACSLDLTFAIGDPE